MRATSTPTPPITSFSGPYRFLSNFHPSPVFYEGILYPSVEHAFQAAKTLDLERRDGIRAASTPGKAKYIGRRVPLRPDWEEIKVGIMAELVWEKFRIHGPLRKLLLDTGDAELVEGNHWGDTFWGVCNGVGENHLGKILMAVREECILVK